MPRRYQLSELVTRCQRRADMENDSSIAAAEWKALISEIYGELHGEVSSTGLRYFETESTVTASGAASYAEPSDHLSTVGVDLVIDSAGRRRELEELMPLEQAQWSGLVGEAHRYTLIDDQLYLYPNPSSGTYKWRYIAQPPDLSTEADATLVDVVTPDGEAFLVWGVAVLALSKGEKDVTLALQRQEQARARLKDWAYNRSLTQPRRLSMPGYGESFNDYDPSDWRWR
jgi:hypothetical protein